MTKNSQHVHSGGCLCGAVRYEASGPPLVVAHCHCEHCQRTSGAGHTTGAFYPVARLRLTGQVSEFASRGENGIEVSRGFCPTCGSSVYSRNEINTERLMITLGTLDDSEGFEPAAVVFSRNRKSWDHMDGALTSSRAMENWPPIGSD